MLGNAPIASVGLGDSQSSSSTTFSVVPSGLPSTLQFGAAAVSFQGVFAVQPSGIPSAAAFGAPSFAFSGAFNVAPAGIASTAVFGSAVFTTPGSFAVLPAGIASNLTFGTASAYFSSGNAPTSARYTLKATSTRTNPAFGEKDPAEVYFIGFDFTGLLTAISTATVTVTRHAGEIDATPGAMLLGAPVISGVKVLQKVQGGVDGTDYTWRCDAIDSDGLHYVASGVQPVRTA